MVKLHEKSSNQHAMPYHHALAEVPRAYLVPPASPRTARQGCCSPGGDNDSALSDKLMSQPDAWRMIHRHAAAAGIAANVGCHAFAQPASPPASPIEAPSARRKWRPTRARARPSSMTGRRSGSLRTRQRGAGGNHLRRRPARLSTQDAGWHVKERAMNLIWWAEHSSQLALLLLTAVATHLLMSFSQTVMHYRLGHRRLGGIFFRNHMDFHHVHYSKDHLASRSYIKNDGDGNNTPFFLIPLTLVILSTYFIFPFPMFLTQIITAFASFSAHVYLDNQYHTSGSTLLRFAWFRRRQQLHFVHHTYGDSNFALIDNFWDKFLGTYRNPDVDSVESGMSIRAAADRWLKSIPVSPRRHDLPRTPAVQMHRENPHINLDEADGSSAAVRSSPSRLVPAAPRAIRR
jgi:hypothetical protein